MKSGHHSKYGPELDFGLMIKTTAPPRYFRCSRLLRWSLLGVTVLLASCEPAGILDPHGPIASAERLLLINSTAIMLVVVIPVIVATLGFAWWYRSSNTLATRSLDESYEGRVELVVWSIPALTGRRIRQTRLPEGVSPRPNGDAAVFAQIGNRLIGDGVFVF
jgi:hypothetical protein